MNGAQFGDIIHSNHSKDYKEYKILESWQTSLLKVEKNYDSFNE